TRCTSQQPRGGHTAPLLLSALLNFATPSLSGFTPPATVVTIAADGSVFNDVLPCGLLRETEADAYADGAALKDRLEIKEIIREATLD
ncbi:hypothetical protein, partial [Paraburkholderia domus]|uniref:hypothetical protein n=1 Tax=Paraburkholderia domus TaxID=2793075 RepID=UPI001B8A9120